MSRAACAGCGPVHRCPGHSLAHFRIGFHAEYIRYRVRYRVRTLPRDHLCTRYKLIRQVVLTCDRYTPSLLSRYKTRYKMIINFIWWNSELHLLFNWSKKFIFLSWKNSQTQPCDENTRKSIHLRFPSVLRSELCELISSKREELMEWLEDYKLQPRLSMRLLRWEWMLVTIVYKKWPLLLLMLRSDDGVPVPDLRSELTKSRKKKEKKTGPSSETVWQQVWHGPAPTHQQQILPQSSLCPPPANMLSKICSGEILWYDCDK